MALNAETIGLLTDELDRLLRDGKIEKVQQPEKDLLLLTVRASGENRNRSAGMPFCIINTRSCSRFG